MSSDNDTSLGVDLNKDITTTENTNITNTLRGLQAQPVFKNKTKENSSMKKKHSGKNGVNQSTSSNTNILTQIIPPPFDNPEMLDNVTKQTSSQQDQSVTPTEGIPSLNNLDFTNPSDPLLTPALGTPAQPVTSIITVNQNDIESEKTKIMSDEERKSAEEFDAQLRNKPNQVTRHPNAMPDKNTEIDLLRVIERMRTEIEGHIKEKEQLLEGSKNTYNAFVLFAQQYVPDEYTDAREEKKAAEKIVAEFMIKTAGESQEVKENSLRRIPPKLPKKVSTWFQTFMLSIAMSLAVLLMFYYANQIRSFVGM